MDKKKKFDLTNPEDIEYLREFMVSDEMAVDSEAEGDDDADDGLAKSSCTPSSTRTTRFRVEEEHTNAYDNNSEDSSDSEMLEESELDAPESIFEDDNFDWTKTSEVPNYFKNFSFTQPNGINAGIEIDIDSPLQIFMTLLTTSFLEYIVHQSNLYASQKNIELALSVDELKAFIGILIIMGMHSLPSIRLYWSTDQNFQVKRIIEIMPLKRFLKILRCLHLNDNMLMPKKGQSNYDKLYKIKPLINHVNAQFKSAFRPSRFLSIDESMIRFKGRSVLKQYMPMKPIKRGFKMWVMACAATGYCLSMSLYEGAEVNASKSKTLGERVVDQLSYGFEGFGYCLFFDNFFSSVPMIRRLLQKKFFVCGTIRQTRKHFPKTILIPDKKMKIGENDGVFSKYVGIAKWKDKGKKSVCVISSMHDPLAATEVLRTQKNGSRKLVKCPVAIADYNKYMGGVDHFDQLLATYDISWKSRRWWMKIFYYCLNAIIVNSYILYKNTLTEIDPKKTSISHLNFRSVLASELIGNFSARTKRGPPTQTGRGRKRNHPDGRPTVYNSTRLVNVGEHLPAKITKYRKCANCSTSKHQKRSNILCTKCDVALCVDKCFIAFHRNQ